jgi:hypothetical protein
LAIAELNACRRDGSRLTSTFRCGRTGAAPQVLGRRACVHDHVRSSSRGRSARREQLIALAVQVPHRKVTRFVLSRMRHDDLVPASERDSAGGHAHLAGSTEKEQPHLVGAYCADARLSPAVVASIS